MNIETQELLKRGVDKITSIQTQIYELKEEEKEVYSQLKANGLNIKVIKKIIKESKKDKEKIKYANELQEEYEIILEKA